MKSEIFSTISVHIKGDVCNSHIIHTKINGRIEQDLIKKLFVEFLKTPNREFKSDDKNLKTEDVNFNYIATQDKQALYENIPVQLSNTIALINAFACHGNRFGLKDILVFVEIKETKITGDRIWAEVFYVADSQIPAIIIECRKTTYSA